MSAVAIARDHSVARPVWEDDGTLSEVRPHVRELLQRSQAFAQLPPEQQGKLANELVRVSAYLARPEGHSPHDLAQIDPLATAQADVNTDAGKRATTDKGPAGKDFEAGAARQYTEAFGSLIGKVDFPAFVGGLVHNVFDAIVDATIKQMQAYAELLANVVKSVEEYASDNVTDNNARDYLAGKFPGELSIQTGSSGSFAAGDDPPPQPKVEIVSENPEETMNKIAKEIGWDKPPSDLSDAASEAELVRRAKLQMARQRQQMLASMVIMGVQRIVVTDGHINAKVVFDMRASDQSERVATASMHDTSAQRSRTQASTSGGGWYSPVQASLSTDVSTSHVATVGSAVDENSESKGELKAKLSGDVMVNFKSDYFPMEKMASPEMINAIQGNAQPGKSPVTPPPAPQAGAGK